MTAVIASSTLQQAFEAATVAALETLTHITKQRDNLREARMAATEILRMARGMFTKPQLAQDERSAPALVPTQRSPAAKSARDESASARRTSREGIDAAHATTTTTPPPIRLGTPAPTPPPPPRRKSARNFMAVAGTSCPVF